MEVKRTKAHNVHIDVASGAVEAVTCKAAVKLYPGISERDFARMCIKGAGLINKYRGNLQNISPAEKAKALFAKKVGKYWMIPITELRRVFLPKESEALKKSTEIKG